MAISITSSPLPATVGLPAVVPAYADLTTVAASTNSSRRNYRLVADVWVDDGTNPAELEASLRVYPDQNGWCAFDPHRILQSHVRSDASMNLVQAAAPNNAAMRHYHLQLGEEYSNLVDVTSVQDASGSLRLNLLVTHRLSVGDRVRIDMDPGPNRERYSTYARVTSVPSTNAVVVDLPYVVPSPSQVETGVLREGVELYDTLFSGGFVQVQTTNAHELNEGDQFVLQMDTVGVAMVRLQSGSSGQVGPITVDGVNIMSSAVAYSGSLANTAALVAANINAHVSSPDYSAYALAGDPTVFIYSRRDANADGLVVTAASTGSLQLLYTPNMHQGRTGPFPDQNGNMLGAGWNPQYSGVWNVTSVIDANNFLTDIPYTGNSVAGSDRGSVMNLGNYRFRSLQRWPSAAGEYVAFFNGTVDQRLDWRNNRDVVTSLIVPASAGVPYGFKRFMSDAYEADGSASARRVTADDLAVLSFLNYDYTYNVTAAVFTMYDASGAVISTSSVPVSLSPSVRSNRWVDVPAGFPNTGLSPAGVDHFTVQLYDLSASPDQALSAPVRFDVICPPDRRAHEISGRPYTRFLWVNSLGGWDAVDFLGEERVRQDVQRYTFTRRSGSVDPANGSYSQTSSDRGDVSFHHDASDVYEVFSGPLTRSESALVRRMVESADVRVQRFDPYSQSEVLVPVVIIDSTEPPASQQKVRSWRVSYRTANAKIIQRG